MPFRPRPHSGTREGNRCRRCKAARQRERRMLPRARQRETRQSENAVVGRSWVCGSPKKILQECLRTGHTSPRRRPRPSLLALYCAFTGISVPECAYRAGAAIRGLTRRHRPLPHRSNAHTIRAHLSPPPAAGVRTSPPAAQPGAPCLRGAPTRPETTGVRSRRCGPGAGSERERRAAACRDRSGGRSWSGCSLRCHAPAS